MDTVKKGYRLIALSAIGLFGIAIYSATKEDYTRASIVLVLAAVMFVIGLTA